MSSEQQNVDPQNAGPVNGDTVDVDPVISDAVENIANRFGAQGLCDLIAVARDELARAEAALKQLSELDA